MRRVVFNSRSYLVAAVAAVAVTAGVIGAPWIMDGNSAAADVTRKLPVPTYTPEEAARAASSAKDLAIAFRAAADKVLPSLVTIENTPSAAPIADAPRGPLRQPAPFGGRNPLEATPFEDMFPDQPFGDFRFEAPPGGPMPRGGGMGSGVVISDKGLVLTNNHVVEGGGEVTVRLWDGREYTATDVWTDPHTDIAVVKIEGDNLTAAKIGNSDMVEIGDWVLALGQPFGLESTVTAGIISAKHRGIGITSRENFLQTDAAINPGNSGGPLVNLDGEVIGINTAISSRSGGNVGIGFAVPINLARWVADQLSDGGVVHRAFLGVGIQPVTANLAKQFNVKPREGVLVTDVFDDTPAAQAGLKSGDVIVTYDGMSVSTPQELQVAVERSEIGKPHPLTIVRNGKRQELELVPREQPSDYGLAARNPQTAPERESVRDEHLGMQFSELTADIAQRLGVDGAEGVVITNVDRDSPADRAGLEVGMVVAEVDRQPVKDVAQMKSLLEKADDDGVLMLVRSSAGSRFVLLKP